MRLRQLAISQPIVFLAPPEVHQSILNFRGKVAKDDIDSKDVIIWLLEQTCCNLKLHDAIRRSSPRHRLSEPDSEHWSCIRINASRSWNLTTRVRMDKLAAEYALSDHYVIRGCSDYLRSRDARLHLPRWPCRITASVYIYIYIYLVSDHARHRHEIASVQDTSASTADLSSPQVMKETAASAIAVETSPATIDCASCGDPFYHRRGRQGIL